MLGAIPGAVATGRSRGIRRHKVQADMAGVVVSPRSGCMIVVSFFIAGCAGMVNRSSVDLVSSELSKTRKIVSFESHLSPDSIQERIRASGCGERVAATSSIAPVGAGLYVPINSRVVFSVDQGDYQDGRKWSVLRVDGTVHSVASGVVLTQTPYGSLVQVLAADKRKVEDIRSKVESGTIFCHWRDFDYPYD